MKPNHPPLSALIKLHAEIGGRMIENRKQPAKLAEDAKHVEAVIRMFEPGFNCRVMSARRRYSDNRVSSAKAIADPVAGIRCSLDNHKGRGIVRVGEGMPARWALGSPKG
jgi:hypothetical protein